MLRLVRATGNLACLAGILWIAGYTLAANPWVMQLYRVDYGNSAHQLAGALARAQTADGDVCLLLGPSSVREGLDPTVMSETEPDLTFLNGATSGGTVLVLDPMTTMVEQSRVRFRCIVVGLNARLMISRSSRLNGHGYTDFLDWLNGREILRRETSRTSRADAAPEIVANTIWPYHRVARQLGRLLRYELHELHLKVTWHEPLSRDAFALVPHELDVAPPFRYNETRPLGPRAWNRWLDRFRSEGMYDPAKYGWPEHVALLHSVLHRLAARTDQLVLIRMPEHSYGRATFAPLGEPSFGPVLNQARAGGACIIDLSDAVPDSWLRDMGHLLSTRRRGFSRRVARRVAACLANPPERPRKQGYALRPDAPSSGRNGRVRAQSEAVLGSKTRLSSSRSSRLRSALPDNTALAYSSRTVMMRRSSGEQRLGWQSR
jgi:hypothetical protein